MNSQQINKSLLSQFKFDLRFLIQNSIFFPFVLLFIITTLLVTPVGEFPLSDDWIFAKAVQRLLEEGIYRGHPYLNATFIAQAYWGALFCKIFGFSFTTLRVSTLVLSCIGAWGIARCGLTIGLPRNLALLCGVLFAINPIALSLSYTFMTDVPFLTASILSGWCFLRALEKSDVKQVFWGSFFGVIAFFVRQFGVMLPIAFIAAAFWQRRKKQFSFSWKTVLALIFPWVIAGGIELYLGTVVDPGSPVFESLKGRIFNSLMDGIRHIPISLCYIGLFTLPLGVGRVWQLLRRYECWTRKQIAVFVGFCGVSLATFFLPKVLFFLKATFFHKEALWLNAYPYRMPLLKGDSLFDLAVGFYHLPDPHPQPVVQIQQWWWPITLAALGVGGMLVVSMFDLLRDRVGGEKQNFTESQKNQRLFLLMWGLILMAVAYNPWRFAVHDRYLLSSLIPFSLLLAQDVSRYNFKVSLRLMTFVCTLIYIFSIIGVQDYLAWNRTAWIAQNKLMTVYNVSPESIRGADTFNGWYNSEKYMKLYNTTNWWEADKSGRGPWVIDDQYIVAGVEPRAGYEVLERIPYFSWLSKERKIVIFKRQEKAGKLAKPLAKSGQSTKHNNKPLLKSGQSPKK